MAIGVPSVVAASASDTDATSYAVASVSFVANRYYLIGTMNGRSGATGSVPTVSGATSGTWTADFSNTFHTIASPVSRLSSRSFYATSSFSEVVTIDFAGVTQIGCAWVMLEITGVRQATPQIQAVGARTDSATSQSVTLSAFASGSMGIGFAACAAQRTFTAANSYTLLGTVQQGAAPVASLQALYKATQGDPGVTWTTAADSSIVGLELAAATSGSWGPSLSDQLNRLVLA